MRQIKTDLRNILELVNCAEDYGFADDVFLEAMAQIAGHVSDEEIKEYAETFLTPEMRAEGYSEEDAEQAARRLTEWRDKYGAQSRREPK